MEGPLNVVTDLSGAKKRFDVCIVGSGAAGCVLAYKISQAGKDVAVLEKGGYYSSEWIEKAPEEELLALWKSAGEQLSRSFGVNVAQAECVGGGTILNYGVCFDTPTPVLEYWQRVFGFSYSANNMKESLQSVRSQLSVEKVRNAGRAHEKIAEGVQALRYHGDWMERNCHNGVKQSALIGYLEKADPRNVMVFPGCEANQIIVSNGKASGVEATFTDPDTKKKEKVSIQSKIVIVSAGAIASSALLLQSGLKNRNGQIGQHLSIHPAAGVIGEFDEEINTNIHLPMAYYCDEFSVRHTGHPGFMIESLVTPPFQLGLDVTSFGEEHLDVMERYSHIVIAGMLVHDEPSGSVSLNWSGEPILDYTLSSYDQKKMILGLEEASRILLAAQAEKVIAPHFQPLAMTKFDDIKHIRERGMASGTLVAATPHPQGGNRMGQNRAYCVVNEHCEIFDVPRLFVCDASVFPTSVGVNPQMTVMGIANLTSDYINDNSSKYFA